MVLHEEDKIHVEDFEKRLEAHREEYGEPDGLEAIELVVCRTDAEDFEQERIGPDEAR